MLSIFRSLACTMAIVAATSFGSHAEILGNNRNTLSQTFTGTIVHSIALTQSGANFVPFSVTTTGKVAITFSAECQHIGSPPAFFGLAIKIGANGVTIPPTDINDFAFCSPSGAASGDWRSQSVTVVKNLNPGNYRVYVDGRVWSGGTVRIDDTSIVIFN